MTSEPTVSESRSASNEVVVVGGGISGLTAAYRLLKAPHDGRPLDVTLLEAGPRVGGKLRTVRLGEIQLEEGADSFVLRKPWAMELCREIGLGDDLVVPASTAAFVWTRGQLIPFPRRSAFGIPAGLEELVGWPGLSTRARLRAAADLILPARGQQGDESIGHLVARRMGREVVDVLVGPLLAGVHAGDAYRLSVEATFPDLAIWERGHGSLIRGARASLASAREKPGPLFATLWSGLSRLASRLEEVVGAARIRSRSAPTAIHRSSSGYEVEVGGRRHQADAVVLATPAFESARLLDSLAPEAAEELKLIEYASTAVISLVYPEGTASLLPDGTGFVVPASLGVTTACTWTSKKWPREEYGDRAILRCYVGRAGQQDVLAASDDELAAAVRREVEAATGLREAPSKVRVVRWERGLPQYEVGHLRRVERVEQALKRAPGVFLAGSAYGGVGISDCVRNATEVAGRVHEYLAGVDSRDGVQRIEREAI